MKGSKQYIFALGSKREVAKEVSKAITAYRIDNIIEHSYRHTTVEGRRIPGVFYECSIYRKLEN